MEREDVAEELPASSDGSLGDAAEHRRSRARPNLGVTAGARRRESMVAISKDRREALVRSKRMRRDLVVVPGSGSGRGSAGGMEVEGDGEGGRQGADEEGEEESEEQRRRMEERANEAVTALKSAIKGPPSALLSSLLSLRQQLSSSSSPPTAAAVKAGAVPLLADCLAFGAPQEQLLEAAWCVTNIASGESEDTRAVLPCAALLVAHCGALSPPSVCEQCVWALGNMAAEGEDVRAVLTRQGAMQPLARMMLEAANQKRTAGRLPAAAASLARTVGWALSSLIKGPSPRAAVDLMGHAGMEAAIACLLSPDNPDVAVEVAWVAAYVAALSDASGKRLVDAGAMEALVQLMSEERGRREGEGQDEWKRERAALLTPVVRAIGNLTAVSPSHSSRFLLAGTSLQGTSIPDSPASLPSLPLTASKGPGLTALTHCIRSDLRGLQKESLWSLSNIAAGLQWHKQAVAGSEAYPAAIHTLNTAAFDVKKEAAFVLANICAPSSSPSPSSDDPSFESHITSLVDAGCLPAFLSLIRSCDAEAVRLGLQVTEVVMRVLTNKRGVRLVEELDGIDAIEAAQFGAVSANEELRQLSSALVDKPGMSPREEREKQGGSSSSNTSNRRSNSSSCESASDQSNARMPCTSWQQTDVQRDKGEDESGGGSGSEGIGERQADSREGSAGGAYSDKGGSGGDREAVSVGIPVDHGSGSAAGMVGGEEDTEEGEVKVKHSAVMSDQKLQLPALSAFWQVLQLLCLAEAYDISLLLLLSLLQIPIFARVGSTTGLFYRALVDIDLPAFHSALLQAALWLALAAVAASLQDWAAQFVSIRWRRALTSKCHAAYCRSGRLYGTVTGIVRVYRRGDRCGARKEERRTEVKGDRPGGDAKGHECIRVSSLKGVSAWEMWASVFFNNSRGAAGRVERLSRQAVRDSVGRLFRCNPMTTRAWGRNRWPWSSPPTAGAVQPGREEEEGRGLLGDISTGRLGDEGSHSVSIVEEEEEGRGGSERAADSRLRRVVHSVCSCCRSECTTPLDNPDQRIAEEIRNFCDCMSKVLLSCISAPLTTVYYLAWVASLIGPFGLAIILLFFCLGAALTRLLFSPVAALVAEQERREATFRAAHARVRDRAEDIAFAGAEAYERRDLDAELASTLANRERLLFQSLCLELATKAFDYGGVAVNYVALAVPVFAGVFGEKSAVGGGLMNGLLAGGRAVGAAASSSEVAAAAVVSGGGLGGVTQLLHFLKASISLPSFLPSCAKGWMGNASQDSFQSLLNVTAGSCTESIRPLSHPLLTAALAAAGAATAAPASASSASASSAAAAAVAVLSAAAAADKGAMAQAISVASFAVLQLIFGLSQIIDASKGAAQVAGYAQRVTQLFAVVGLMEGSPSSSSCASTSSPSTSSSSLSPPSPPPCASAAARVLASSPLHGQSQSSVEPLSTPSPSSPSDVGELAEAEAGEHQPQQKEQQQQQPCILTIRSLNVQVPQSDDGSAVGKGECYRQERTVFTDHMTVTAESDALPSLKQDSGSFSPEAAAVMAKATGSVQGRNLLTNLNLDLPAGHHLLVTGPSGCGKTSLLRVLRGMWLPACTDTDGTSDTDIAGRQGGKDGSTRSDDRFDTYANQGSDGIGESGRYANGLAGNRCSHRHRGSSGESSRDVSGGRSGGGGFMNGVSGGITAHGSEAVARGSGCDRESELDGQQNKRELKESFCPSVDEVGGCRVCCSCRAAVPPVVPSPVHTLELQLTSDAMFLTARPLFARYASLAEQVVYPLTLTQAATWLAATQRMEGRVTIASTDTRSRSWSWSHEAYQPRNLPYHRCAITPPPELQCQHEPMGEQALLSVLERVHQALDVVGLKHGALHLQQVSDDRVDDETAGIAASWLRCHASALKLLARPREGTSWESILSRGEQQKLQFTRALFYSPSLVFLDEAMSAVDRCQKNKMLASLKRQGSTIVSVSHDLEGMEPWFLINLHLKGRQEGGGWAVAKRTALEGHFQG